MTLYYTAVLKSMATCHHIMGQGGQGWDLDWLHLCAVLSYVLKITLCYSAVL